MIWAGKFAFTKIQWIVKKSLQKVISSEVTLLGGNYENYNFRWIIIYRRGKYFIKKKNLGKSKFSQTKHWMHWAFGSLQSINLQHILQELVALQRQTESQCIQLWGKKNLLQKFKLQKVHTCMIFMQIKCLVSRHEWFPAFVIIVWSKGPPP